MGSGIVQFVIVAAAAVSVGLIGSIYILIKSKSSMPATDWGVL